MSQGSLTTAGFAVEIYGGPDEVVRTADAGQLSAEELEALCQKSKFKDSPFALRKQ
jgi:hypothetical protein